MEKEILELLQKSFEITELKMDEYQKIDKPFMHFITTPYEIKGVGHLVKMDMKGMLGMMKMETITLTSRDVDAPILSFDFIQVGKNNTLLLELYDTCLTPLDVSSMEEIKTKYASLPDGESKPNWYDSMKMKPTLKKKVKGQREELTSLAKEWVSAYLECLKKAPSVDPEEKTKKNQEYVDGLLTHGGPSTDRFKKMIGEEETKRFFYRYFFGLEKSN